MSGRVRRRLGALVVCSGLFMACSDSDSAEEATQQQASAEPARWVELNPEAVARGKATFGTCMGCHGKEAEGMIGIGPRIASDSYLAAASDDFLVETIKYGRAGTTMVPWGQQFDDATIRSVVAYLRSLHPVEPAKLDRSPLEGELAEGQRIFRDICSGCHGRSGAGYQETANGTGIGRKGFLEKASNGFIRYVVSHGKTQTMMRGFGEDERTAIVNLSPKQIDSTIAYLRANAW